MRLVDRDISQPSNKFGPAVFTRPRGQKVGTLLNEGRGDISRGKSLVLNNSLQKRNVGGDTSNAKFGKTPFGPGDRRREIPSASRHFCEHRVKIGRNLGALAYGSAI